MGCRSNGAMWEVWFTHLPAQDQGNRDEQRLLSVIDTERVYSWTGHWERPMATKDTDQTAMIRTNRITAIWTILLLQTPAWLSTLQSSSWLHDAPLRQWLCPRCWWHWRWRWLQRVQWSLRRRLSRSFGSLGAPCWCWCWDGFVRLVLSSVLYTSDQ